MLNIPIESTNFCNNLEAVRDRMLLTSYSLIGSRPRARLVPKSNWPCMTLNGVMTVDRRYLCASWASCYDSQPPHIHHHQQQHHHDENLLRRPLQGLSGAVQAYHRRQTIQTTQLGCKFSLPNIATGLFWNGYKYLSIKTLFLKITS